MHAPLNVSSALSPLSSLAHPHSASEQARHSVPDSRQQGEYPPHVVTRVQRRPQTPCSYANSASPDCKDGAYPLEGVPSTGGNTGLVVPLTHVAVSSPVAEFDPSGLVRTGPACHSIAKQSSSQSEAHTALSATDGRLSGPLDPSKFRVPPSCGPAHAPTHTHAHTAFQFQLASSQCPLSTGEPSTAVTPERHSAFLRRPELLASIDLDSDSEYPELVDDDTSSGEEEEEETVASLDRTVKNRGRGTVKSEPQKERTVFKFNSDTALRLHERSIRDRLRTSDWNRLYRDKTGVYRPCILRGEVLSFEWKTSGNRCKCVRYTCPNEAKKSRWRQK